MKRTLLACSLGLFLVPLDAGPALPAEPTVGETAPQPPPDSSKKKDGETLSHLAALKDKDPKVRRQAVAALGRLGGKAAVEPLIAALNDEDASVRYAVAEALFTLGDKRAVEPLRAALKRNDGAVSESVAFALAALAKDEAAVEPLLAALEHPASEWTPLMVLGALMQIGPPAVKPLVAALRHPSQKVRRVVVEALAILGEERAVEPLIKALGDCDGDVARVAAFGLARLDDPRAVTPLAAAIKDRRSALWWAESTSPNEQTDRIAALAAGMPADLAPLVSAMEDPRRELRYSAAWVLGRLGDKRAVEALATVLKSAEQAPTLDGVWLCGQALARLQSPLGIAPLMRVVKDHDDGDGPQHDMGSPELKAWLRRRWQKETSKTIETLAAIGPAAVGPLVASLRDQSPGVRAVAAQGLGRIGDKRAVDALKAALNDPNQRVRDSAAEAIRVINLNTPK